MKKVFIMFVAFAYLNCYLGCTKTALKEITTSDLTSVRSQSQTFIVIKDSNAIEFQAQTCRIVEDTLIGKVNIVGGEKQSYKIPLNEIDKIVLPEKEITVMGYILYGIFSIGAAIGMYYGFKLMIESFVHF